MYKWLSVLIAVYSLFTLGVVFEVFGMSDVSRVEIPYSIAISGERTGLSIVTTQGDLDCVNWLLANHRDDKIIADHNGALLARSYFPFDNYPELWNGPIPKGTYVFCTKWNEDRGKYVMAVEIGSRVLAPIDYTGLVKVYQSGGAVVYEKR
jgi:hypothetical protein